MGDRETEDTVDYWIVLVRGVYAGREFAETAVDFCATMAVNLVIKVLYTIVAAFVGVPGILAYIRPPEVVELKVCAAMRAAISWIGEFVRAVLPSRGIVFILAMAGMLLLSFAEWSQGGLEYVYSESPMSELAKIELIFFLRIMGSVSGMTVVVQILTTYFAIKHEEDVSYIGTLSILLLLPFLFVMYLSAMPKPIRNP